MDRFLLQHPLSDGRTVLERFVRSRGDLPAEERAMLLAWREVVEGLRLTRGGRPGSCYRGGVPPTCGTVPRERTRPLRADDPLGGRQRRQAKGVTARHDILALPLCARLGTNPATPATNEGTAGFTS